MSCASALVSAVSCVTRFVVVLARALAGLQVEGVRLLQRICDDGLPRSLHQVHPFFFFLRHGGPPLKALHKSGLTMGKMSVHGEPKFSEGQPRVFTNLVRVKTLHELHHGPEKVKILVEAISVKDAKGYIAYTKAK